ncbi:MAG: amidophosphoribosyltransferase [Verrucomicrobiae bacterium]|nr:amidophosphoribosyltransferase [Verrucomicrobiae bacterium]
MSADPHGGLFSDEPLRRVGGDDEGRPREACGLFGVYGHPNAALLTYYGLYALQHRGQESAGIVTYDAQRKRMIWHKDMGLVYQVFQSPFLESLTGEMAMGHVRYSTTGSSLESNAQPLIVATGRGQVALAHNGNLVNSGQLRESLEEEGAIFQTTTDSEIILHLLARGMRGDRGNSLVAALRRLQGAYSLTIMTETELIGVRDPLGFRPLCLGRLWPPSKPGAAAWVLSSESCALDQIQAEFVRDIEPGEIVIIDQNGVRSVKPFDSGSRHALCIFEFVYFARPDSSLHGQVVHRARVKLGQLLAREHPVKADIVVPVPDSGNSAALGYSQESGIPLEMAFVRNHYIGRSFLQPSQLIRDFSVRVKLNLIKELVRGKRVVVVDDSIVRGTTSKARVATLREAGAKEVHMRISCPPHKWPCHYGIDFPSRGQLMAANNSIEEIKNYLGADSLGYLSLGSMIAATGLPASEFCTACYSGDYPVTIPPEINKEVLENRGSRPARVGDLIAEDPQRRLL